MLALVAVAIFGYGLWTILQAYRLERRIADVTRYREYEVLVREVDRKQLQGYLFVVAGILLLVNLLIS